MNEEVIEQGEITDEIKPLRIEAREEVLRRLYGILEQYEVLVVRHNELYNEKEKLGDKVTMLKEKLLC